MSVDAAIVNPVDLAGIAAQLIPAAEALSPQQVVSGAEVPLGEFAGAAVVELSAPLTGRLAVLVTGELVSALSGSPVGELSVAAALQPALDKMAESLGGSCGQAVEVPSAEVPAAIGSPFSVVMLAGSDLVHAALAVPAGLAAHHEAMAPNTPGFQSTAPQAAAPVASAAPAMGLPGMRLLHNVVMDVTVELGRTRMTVRELLELAPGDVLELDRAAGSPADLLVSGELIARGEVVVVDDSFGLRITEIVDTSAGI